MAGPPSSLFTLHSPVKQELNSDSSTPMQHQSLPALPPFKREPLDLSDGGPQALSGTQFFQSIDQLRNLSSVINEFYRRFDDLKQHLDFIQTSIDARSNGRKNIPPVLAIAPPPMSDSPAEQATAEAVIVESDRPESISVPAKSELVNLCESMCGKGLRKYLISHISKIRDLLVEVPTALKCAPNPAKLVLDCFGRFYLQGIRANNKKSPMISGRKASLLILESFLLMMNDDTEFDADVKQEAEQAAVAWRKRLMAEGGLSKASEADARGLLLLIGCYGIPKVFSNENVLDLVRLSNSRLIEGALRRSHVLVKRVSDILERMMNTTVKIEAVDVAYTFGLEDKFPPQKIVSSYLRDSKEAMKRRTREANNSPVLLKDASERQLAALKSVVKFLADRQLDPDKLLAGWQIRETIDSLEKDIAELSKKIDEREDAKRKADELELLSNLKNQEVKRLRYAGSPIVSPSLGSLEQRAPYQLHGNGLYSGSMRLNLPDGTAFPGHVSNTAVGSVMRGSGSYDVPSASSYAGTRAELLGQKTGVSVVSYGRHGVGDGSFSYGYQPALGLLGPSAAVKAYGGMPNSSPTPNRSSGSDLYRFADIVN